MNKEEKEFKTVHIECIGEKSDRLARDIKLILQGKELKKLCDLEIRLIPQFDYTESVTYNEKVKACIMIQKQFITQIDSREVDLDSVETIIKENKYKTLREHILEMNKEEKTPKMLFIEKNGTIKDTKYFIPRLMQN